MSTSKLIIFCFLFAFFGLSTNVIAEKYAIIIAIGDYPDDGGWPDISSGNDVPLVKNALNEVGFADENIVIIRDEEATKANIIEQLDLLKSRVAKDDVIYIHFSGHGQQVVDNNKDELDQLDEAIVPYNSPLKYEAGKNEGEFLIRDDELGQMTSALRKKVGKSGQLILVLDSCHSGTGTRGLAKARGTDKIMAPDNFTPISSNERSMQINSESTDQLAPMASFFGASAKELNYETLDNENNPVGSLSFAFSEVLANMQNSMTFEEIFNMVKLKMKKFAPMQQPQWEGPQNTNIFGEQEFSKEVNYLITNIKGSDVIQINCGTLVNVFEGSKVAVYDSSNENLITRGVVTNSTLNTSSILLDEGLDKEASSTYHVLIEEKALPAIELNIHSTIENTSQWSELNHDVCDLSFVTICDSNADLYLKETEEGDMHLETKEGRVLCEIEGSRSNEANNLSYIKQCVIQYMQGMFLRSFHMNNPRIDVDLEFIQVDFKTNKESIIDQSEIVNLKAGTVIKFKINNNGIIPIYFSLLDIQPDNYVNLVLPAIGLGYTAEEYYLEPGESMTTNFTIEIAEPYGEETLLLMASKKPQDLSGIIQSQGNTSRGLGELDSFEQLLSTSYGNNTSRGIKVKTGKKEMISTKTIFFNIVKN